ncbi:non-ribosomal peptide synthetase [Pseudochelatococcus sp. B33]
MISRDNIKDIYPLTAFQEGVAFHDLMEQEGPDGSQRAYFQQMRFTLRGPLDADAFERAFALLVERHDIFRTVFRLTGAERPLQIVLKSRHFACERATLSGLDAGARRREVELYAEGDRNRPFDLRSDLLLRVALLKEDADLTHVVFSFHHILMDGACIGILQHELTLAYQAFARGQRPDLPPPAPFSAFVELSVARREAAGLGYWQRYLAGYETALGLPAARPHALRGRRDTRTHTVTLPAALTHALAALARRAGATFNSLVQGLWGLLLARMQDRDDVVFGAMASTRPQDMPEAEAILGPCIGMLPLRISLEEGETAIGFLRRLQRERMDWLDNVHCALGDIQTVTPLRQGLINHYFVFENYALEERFKGEAQELGMGVTIGDISMYQTNNYDFGVVSLPGEALRIDFTYNADAVDPDGVALIGRLLRSLAEQIVAHPDRPLSGIGLLDEAELERVVALGRGREAEPATHSPAPWANDLRALRAAIVERSGTEPALRLGARLVSHADLERRARRLAARLVHAPGPPDRTPVALHADAGEELMTAMLACLLAGVPYVPLDIQSPGARLAHIVNDSGARLVLSHAPERLAGVVAEHVQVLDIASVLAAAAGSGEPPPLPAMPPDPTAYIIYTSGTTGVPKGVRVGHAALLAYVSWLRRRFGSARPLRTALLTSPCFDLGYTAVYGALLGGGCLSLFDEDERRNPELVLDALSGHRWTMLKLTPSYLSMLLQIPQAEERFRRPNDLQLLLLGGEAQNFGDLRRLRGWLPGLDIANHYGPTETTIGCISGSLNDLAEAGAGPQRIGRPITGAHAFVCDRRLRPLPEGVVGELVVGGLGLAQGYVNPSPADADRFTQLPWCADLPVYCTGDRACWLADGQLAFLGRSDDQVKVRGYRVSLKEVEAAIRDLPGVRDAALVTDTRTGAAELVAYVILDEEKPAGPAQLRAALATRLPDAMVPGRFIPVSRFPMTANGKIDRKAMAEHWLTAAAGSVSDPDDGRPGSALEETLRGIWQDVLFLERVGLDDDFFALGGHSLKAILIISKARAKLERAKLERPLSLRSLFDHPTIRRLAAHLENPAPADGAPVLLNLRQGSPGAPLAFFFPPALGTSTVYRELTERLDCDVTCYGLQSPGFDADVPFLPSLAASADYFAALIGPMASAHPLRLVGWSLGALFAFETARLLEARGREVSLVLLDPSPLAPRPDGRSADGCGTPAPELRFAELRTLPYWGRVLSIMEQLPPDDFARIERLAAHHRRIAHAGAIDAPVTAAIDCLEARDAGGGAAGLRALTGGRFTLHEVGGDHYSMFHPPHVHAVLSLLRRLLDAGESHDGRLSA